MMTNQDTTCQISPVLVVNDNTGEFVISANITRVIAHKGGTRVYTKLDNTNGEGVATSYMKSPLTPKQLYNRLYGLAG